MNINIQKKNEESKLHEITDVDYLIELINGEDKNKTRENLKADAKKKPKSKKNNNKQKNELKTTEETNTTRDKIPNKNTNKNSNKNSNNLNNSINNKSLNNLVNIGDKSFKEKGQVPSSTIDLTPNPKEESKLELKSKSFQKDIYQNQNFTADEEDENDEEVKKFKSFLNNIPPCKNKIQPNLLPQSIKFFIEETAKNVAVYSS